MTVDNVYYLSQSKFDDLIKRGIDFTITCGDEYEKVTAEQLYKYLPREVEIDGDMCHINISDDIIDGEDLYIVSYDRISDMYTCMTFHGDKLTDVLYDAIVYMDENKKLAKECYRESYYD